MAIVDQAVLNALELYDSEAKNLNLSENRDDSLTGKCIPGYFSPASMDDWKDRFPNGFGMSEKAVIAIPVGGKSTELMDYMVKQVG